MQKIERLMCGIPFFLLVEYLEEMGGTVIGEGHVQGTGWQVWVSRAEPFRLGSLVIGQNQLEIEIEDHLADDFMERFSQKTMRAGG